MNEQEQLSIRERARRAYEKRVGEVKARMMERHEEDAQTDWNWCLETFGVLLDDFATEGIKARVCRYRDGRPYGLQVEGTDLFTDKAAWSTPCTTWAEIGEMLDPDTFTPDDPDDIATPPITVTTSTWYNDLLDAIERGLAERGRL